MLRTETVTLETNDGAEVFTVGQLPAMKGVRLVAALARLVGPGVKGLNEADIGRLLGSLREDDVEQFVRMLISTVRVGTQELAPVFDVKFAGRFTELVKLLQLSLKVNLGDFSTALAAVTSAAGASPLKSPTS